MTSSNYKISSVKRLSALAAVITVVFLNSAFAATIVKANNATALNVGTSWTGNTAPGSGDTAVWNASSGGTGFTVGLGGNVSWKEMKITTGSGWITLNAGSTLTLGTSGIDMSGTSISMTINCLVALGANQAWNIGPAYELALTGILSGAYSLNKTGTGLLILDAVNTYSGGTTISAGTLQVQNTAALGNTGNTLTISSGGALDVYNIDLRSYTSIPQINGQVNSTTGAIINTGGNGTTSSDVLRGFTLGSDASIGCNNDRFDIGRTYSGNTYITGNSHTLTKVGSNQVCVLTQSTGLTSIVVNGGILSGEVTNVFGGAPITVNSGGQISQWNTLTLSDSIFLNGGTLLGQFEYGNAFSSIWSGPIALAASTIDTLMADVTSVVNSITLSGKMSGSGSLIKAGTGLVILSNTNNNFGGGLTINQGVLQLGASNVLPDGASAGDVTVNDTLDMHGYSEGINGLSGAGTGVVTTKAAGTPTLTVGNNNASSTFSGIIQDGSGTVLITKIGAGTITLTGNNTSSGAITVNAGKLRLIGTPTSAALKYTINGGTISVPDRLNLSAFPVFSADWMTLNGGTLSTGVVSGQTYGNTRGFTMGASGGTIDIPNTDNSNVVIIAVAIAGPGALTKTGVGTLGFTGANTYSGNTTISAGTLQLGASGVIPDGAGKGDVSVAGTLDMNGYSEGINGLSGAGTITSGAAGSITLTVGNNNDTSTFGGIIQNGSGTVAFTKAGSGVITLSGANTYTGATTVGAGTLLITNSTGSGTGTGSVGVSSGATLGGTGTIGTKASTVTVNSGATLAPGAGSTGRLTINNNLTFVSGATLNLNINSNTPMTGYDQVFDTGTVTLGSATLTLTLGYAPTSGQTFTIIDNDGADAVVNTFNGIAQGGSVTATYNSVVYTFTVSYTGGTGNDVVLTCASTGANKIWTNGGGGNNWNTPANWSPSGVPTSGDTVSFQSSYTANCNLNVNDTVRAISFTAGYTGTFNFSTYKLSISGTFGDFRSGGTITVGSGALEFSGTTGKAQVFSPKSTGTFPAIAHTGADTLRLSANALSAASFTQSAGSLDFNGLNITTTGDFTLSSGGNASLVNFGGRKITVGGNASLSGAQANALYISPATPCSLAVTGTLTAYGATMSNCKASGTAAGTATNSTDAGGNYRWTFVNTAEDYTQWHYSKKVYINTKEGGANISTDQSNFPLLVRLTSANFNFNQAQSSGQDVRFSKSDGTHFNYQIERWDNANQVAEVWVNVDVIKGYNDAQYIWMYWGKSNAMDSSSSSKVFATANNFAGVWHLNNSDFTDATSNHNNATNYGTTDTVGVIGTSRKFVYTNPDSIRVTGLLGSPATVTVSAWVKVEAIDATSGSIVSMGDNVVLEHKTYIQDAYRYSSGWNTSASTTNLIGAGWSYVTFVCNPGSSSQLIYVNGQQVVSAANNTAIAYNLGPNTLFGRNGNGGTASDFGGLMDEIRIENTARSADWIALCYQTQKANQTTVTVQENYSEWTYSKNLYFNTKPSGANVTNNVVKFPILVRLDSTNFDFTTAQDSGQDIRFAKSDGTHLYYQIEKWDNIGQQAFVWVRADTIYGNDSLRYATMYWGNVNVYGMSNGKAVFDTGNGFQGVWHFNEGNNSTANDATVNGYNGAASGTTPPSDTAGAIGQCRKYDGTTSYFSCTGTASSKLNFPQGGIYSISAWVNSNVVTAGHDIVCKADQQYALHISTGANWEFVEFNATDGWESVGYAPNLGWTHLVGVRNGANEYLYVNGVMVDNTITTNSSGTRVTNTDVCLGRQGDASARFWNGKIDEAEMCNVARSADWIKLSYENQKPVQDLVVYSNEDYSQWAYSRKINLNTTPSGANVTTNQYNFPTLVRLTNTNFPFAQALDDGSDVRFASSLGKRMAYQIERWDRINQLAEIWVLADTIKGNNGTQYFNMYWGKTGVGTRSKGADVFDTANGFAGVWHLTEGSGNAFDATINGITDTAKGTIKYQKTGGVAYSDSLTGASSYLVAGNGYNTLLNMHTRNKVTVSAWVNRAGVATGNPGDEGIAGKYKWASANAREYCIGNNATLGFTFYLSTDGTSTNETVLRSGVVPTNGAWYFVTGVMDATNMTIFVNGVQKAQTAKTTISNTTTAPFKIGEIDDDGGTNKQYFNGEIDEVIVSDTNRSVDWVKLCYENQKANQTLVDLDDYNQWASSKKIYINTSVVSPALGAKVAMFPLLVRLDTTMINFSAAQSNGEDIRFSRADGTHFYYEREKWDQANKNAALWVLVDTILPSSSTQYVTMYWGKSDAVDKSNSSAVFDTANSFVAAYHFSVSDTFGDASYNSNDGTNSSTTPSASSIIGYGRNFAKASSQKITAADANVLDLTGSFTLSAWINPTTLDTADIIGKDSTAFDLEMIPTKYIRLGSNKTYYLSSAASTITAGSWYHVAATYNSTGNPILFYVNGSQVGTSVTGAAPVATATTLYIGARASGKYFNGSIDEPRVEKACRSADWINLCYWTQKAGVSTVITDTSSEVFLPLTVSPYPASGTALDSCTIATHNWTIKFSAVSRGGGISWLSPDSMGAATNQLDTNLFTILTDNDSSSKGAATLQILDKSNVFVRLLQQRTIGTTHPLQYQVYYTILGNGKAYIRVYTYGASAVTPSNGLEFRIATSSGSANYSPSATASSCNYLLHSDATLNRLDPCLALFENWSQASSITTGANYVGIRSSSWKIPDHRSQAWEFMLDLAHRNWNDSIGVGSYISEYNHPDSLTFYAGTPYLEKTWEDHLSGHLKFEEGTGDTAFDNSGSNNFGIRTAASTWNWTSGKWGGGLGLRSGDTVKILDNTAFDGGSSGFTILSWINPSNTLTGVSGIFRKSTGAAGYALTGGSNGTIQLNLGGTTFSGRTNVGYGSWRHVGAVYEKINGSPDTVRLFVDGKPDTVITGSNYSFSSSGVNALAGNGFSGTIDDVRFYNEAISDEQLKTIYQLGWSSGQGIYMLRADNSSQVNFTIDGGAYHRNFPVFQVSNWWNTSALGANNPYVYMNGSQLVYNKDYYVMTDANIKKATVGLNRAINTDGTRIYIGSDAAQAGTTGAMARMYWGITTLKGIDYVWLRNFSGDVFGSSTAGQFFIDWKMGITGSKGGDIWYMMSSKTTPNTIIDTTGSHATSQGLIPGTDATNGATWGAFGMSINGGYVKSSISTAPFTYTIPESSAVRVVIKLGQRDLSDSAYIFTQWTIYPTGQVFRWDSIPWVKSTNISQVVHSFGLDNCTSPTITMNKKFMRGHVSNSALQDYCIAFLSFKNNGGTVAGPWTKDTMNNASDGTKTQIEFKDATTSPNTVWSAVPVQCNFYQDFQKPAMDSAYRDSVCKGVQNSIGTPGSSRLTANGNGSTVLNSPGDLNGDGFNEKEGAYIYQADNANIAHFTMTAHLDTCRFNPAFRITNYTATTVPQYVFVAGQTLVQGYGYNAYLKQSTHELIMQIKQTICANTDIYIASDKTLAVTMDNFSASGADASVRLGWSTESEENNLGFFLYRRVKPRFVDSLLMSPATISVADTSSDNGDEKSSGLLFKSKAIGIADTVWKQVNDRIIFGALAGVSYGKRAYSWLDRGVFNGVQYEYKLIAVDYNNGRDAYNKLANAMPHRILPQAFELHGNYPNPFRGITYLKFDVPVKTRGMLNVYSMQGRLIRRIVKPDNIMKPGFYRVSWDGKDDAGRLMASGPYIYRFSAPGFAKAKVMIVMK